MGWMAIATEMLLKENAHIIKPVHLTNFSILFILSVFVAYARSNKSEALSHFPILSTTPCAENPPNIPTRSTFKNERVRKKNAS